MPPSISPIIVSNFNPITPSIITPSTFSPVSLNFVATGFGQTNTYGINGTQGITFLNYAEVNSVGNVVINSASGTSYTGSIDYKTPSSPYSTLSNNSNSYKMNAFYSMVQNHDSIVQGNFTVNNNYSVHDTVRFISLNPYEVNGTAKKQVFQEL